MYEFLKVNQSWVNGKWVTDSSATQIVDSRFRENFFSGWGWACPNDVTEHIKRGVKVTSTCPNNTLRSLNIIRSLRTVKQVKRVYERLDSTAKSTALYVLKQRYDGNCSKAFAEWFRTL